MKKSLLLIAALAGCIGATPMKYVGSYQRDSATFCQIYQNLDYMFLVNRCCDLQGICVESTLTSSIGSGASVDSKTLNDIEYHLRQMDTRQRLQYYRNGWK